MTRLALFMAAALLATPAAADPVLAQRLNALTRDWQALSGSVDALVGIQANIADRLQALIKGYEQTEAGKADAESRLKWVLDNWVPN